VASGAGAAVWASAKVELKARDEKARAEIDLKFTVHLIASRVVEKWIVAGRAA
jgi:hypothetical protein